MRRSTYIMLALAYCYAKFLGIINFSYDRQSQRAYKDNCSTIYAALINVAIFCVIPYFGMTIRIKEIPPGSAELIYKMSILITFIRIGGALTTIIFNWTKRNEFINLINSFLQFRHNFLQKYHKEEKFKKYIEKGVRAKCQASLASDFIVFMAAMQNFHVLFEISNIYLIMALGIMPSILNVIMTHYYFALLNVNVLLIIINEELESILKVSEEYGIRDIKINSILIFNYISGLSDYVNVLAQTVIKLQQYVLRVNSIYDIQSICCMLTIFVNNIAVVYTTFMTSSPENLWKQLNSLSGIIKLLFLLIHYWDLHLFIYSLLDASKLVNKLGELLKIKQSWSSYRDKSLERSFLNFSLQVAAFPLDIDLMGLYVANKPMAFAIFSSTIAISLVLMQYDFKYK
ncbi:putative gustatory receptor 59d [Cochliomyia hominivorax]